MTRHLFFTCCILLFFSTSYAGDTLRALFIGNSYTYVNDLPQLISGLATASGDRLIYSSSTPGGYKFQQHLSDANTRALIAQGNWDYVILQEQSQLPSFSDGQVAAQVYPYARQLDSIIKVQNPCAKTVFYMTWGRKNGDASNCGVFPPVCTYTGMDSMLQLRYTIMADANKAVLCPVAKVWRSLRNSSPSLNLYDPDESHPSINGSFAAACSFYSILFKKNPALNSFNSTLSAADATIVKTAAKQIVFDSLGKWYSYYPSVAAGFSFVRSGNTANFSGNTVSGATYSWNFGDGSTAATQNPSHTYTSPGAYQVKLTVKRCKDSAVIIRTVYINTTSITGISRQPVIVYPNPAGDVCFIETSEQISGYLISDLQGRTLMRDHDVSGKKISIHTAQLVPGYYQVHVFTATGTIIHTLYKQ